MGYKKLETNMDVFVIVHKANGKIHHSATNPWYNKVSAAKNGMTNIPLEGRIHSPENRKMLNEKWQALQARADFNWNLPEVEEHRKLERSLYETIQIRAGYEIRKAKITLVLGDTVPYVQSS